MDKICYYTNMLGANLYKPSEQKGFLQKNVFTHKVNQCLSGWSTPNTLHTSQITNDI